MVLKKRSSRRSHSMLRNAGISEPTSLPVEAFKGTCCKMFFPCTESNGTTITDVVGGVQLTTDAVITSTVADTSYFTVYNAGAGVIPSAGTIPDVGTDSFILFGFAKVSDSIGRGQLVVRIGDMDKNNDSKFYQFADGDATDARDTSTTPDTIIVGTETNIGTLPEGLEACAAIRDGDSWGTWIHNDPVPGIDNDYVANGDMFLRRSDVALRGGNGEIGEIQPDARISRNDYGLTLNSLEYDWWHGLDTYEPGFGAMEDSAPGLWSYINPATAMPYENRIQISISGISANHWYGLALFQFSDGLPSDYKEALRWMKAQWQAGNKTIWPDWISVA